MYARPAGNGQQHVVGAFAAVEHVHAVKIKIYYVNLRVMLPQVVPQLIHIVAPAAVHQHQVFAVKVGKL